MRSMSDSPQGQRAEADSSKSTSQQRDRSSLRSDPHRGASSKQESRSRHSTTTRAATTSSDSALPPGAPKGSRINSVSYRSNTIKALIDPGLRVSDVIRQLCANAHLGVQEPPALFALRDDQDEELITDNNMARKIKAGRNFKLCSSPTIEAVEMVDKLSSQDDKALKMATYTLQRLIRDKPFYDEFLKRGGLEELVSIVMLLESGNTLAYALTCVQNLLECCNRDLMTLDAPFVRKVVKILVHQERINVCRPATAILKKLVVTGQDDESEEESKDPGEPRSSKTTRFGFEVVYGEIQKEPNFLPTLMQRLGSADTTLCQYSLSLINSLMRHVSDNLFDAFTAELERLGVPRAVSGLMDSSRGDELISSILEYQMNIIRIAHHRLDTAVIPTDKRHVSALSYIWMQARTSESVGVGEGGSGQRYKWRKLGFENENVAKDFSRTGWLGLECCEAFVRTDPEHFAKIILEQLNRPVSRRCPWGKASLEVVEILSDHYDIQSGYSTCTKFQPCLLNLTRLHTLALRFFLRMWSESGAAASDFGRVSALVRSQAKEALRDETSRSWFDVESDFLESDYRIVRDRQMRELEVEDDFTSKASVRNLRGRLYRESYEFVRQQRIQCLLEGAWFRNAANSFSSPSAANNKSSSTRPMINTVALTSKPWRFYRLSPNRRYLYYCEASQRGPIRSGLDDLPERIDLNLVTDVSIHSPAPPAAIAANGDDMALIGSAQGTVTTNGNGVGSYDANPGISSSSLAFSLLRSSEVSLADFIALNPSQFSEWTDGLSMLRSEGGLISTRETAEYIQILTDIGVKVKLLDLSGESVDIPTTISPAPVPISTTFFFAEL